MLRYVKQGNLNGGRKIVVEVAGDNGKTTMANGEAVQQGTFYLAKK